MNRPSVQSFVPPEWKARIERHECPVCGTPRVAFDPPRKKFCSDKCQQEYGKRWKVWAEVRAKVLIRDKYTCQYPGCGMNIQTAEKIHEETREAHDKENIAWVTTNCIDLIEAEQAQRMETASRMMEEAVDLESIVKQVYNGLRFRARDRYNQLPRIPPEDAHRVNLNLEVDHKNPVANGGQLWDEANLWTLCEKHHKMKTKEDMKKIKASRQTQPSKAASLTRHAMNNITLKPLWFRKDAIIRGYEAGYGPRDRKMHIGAIDQPSVRRLVGIISHESLHRVLHDRFGYAICKQYQSIQYNLGWYKWIRSMSTRAGLKPHI